MEPPLFSSTYRELLRTPQGPRPWVWLVYSCVLIAIDPSTHARRHGHCAGALRALNTTRVNTCSERAPRKQPALRERKPRERKPRDPGPVGPGGSKRHAAFVSMPAHPGTDSRSLLLSESASPVTQAPAPAACRAPRKQPALRERKPRASPATRSLLDESASPAQ